jgi:hypothetical protein
LDGKLKTKGLTVSFGDRDGIVSNRQGCPVLPDEVKGFDSFSGFNGKGFFMYEVILKMPPYEKTLALSGETEAEADTQLADPETEGRTAAQGAKLFV